MNKPSKPIFKEEYRFNTLPEFTNIIFRDDFRLETVEYKLSLPGQNNWITISDNINDKSYTEKWSLSQDDWDAMSEDERYYLYFRLTDFCSNQYITTSDKEALNITKDITEPTIEITLEFTDFIEGGWDDSFLIYTIVPIEVKVDYVNLEYAYSPDNSIWSDWKQYGDELSEAPFKWDFKATKGSGYYRFKTIISDAAGNSVESPIEKISVSLFPTTLVLLMIVIIFILIIVTFRVIKKMKKLKA